MDYNQGKIDKAFQNKPKLFRVSQSQNNNFYASNPMMGYPPQNQMYYQQQYMPFYPQMNHYDPYYQAQFENSQGMMNQQQLNIPLNLIQEENEQANSNQENRSSQAQNLEQSSKIQYTNKKSFNFNNMPPPPPPPPEMIKALAQLVEAGQNQQELLQQQTLPTSFPQFPTLVPQSMVKSSNKIHITKHFYKNQNVPDEPLNPKFIKPNK